jgi:hypothetical protein
MAKRKQGLIRGTGTHLVPTREAQRLEPIRDPPKRRFLPAESAMREARARHFSSVRSKNVVNTRIQPNIRPGGDGAVVIERACRDAGRRD